MNLTQPIDPNLMKNHFEIGDANAPFEQGTCYQRDMKPFDPEIYKQDGQNELYGRDRKSNWDFGDFDNEWRSEAQNQYSIVNLASKRSLFLQKLTTRIKANRLITLKRERISRW